MVHNDSDPTKTIKNDVLSTLGLLHSAHRVHDRTRITRPH